MNRVERLVLQLPYQLCEAMDRYCGLPLVVPQRSFRHPLEHRSVNTDWCLQLCMTEQQKSQKKLQRLLPLTDNAKLLKNHLHEGITKDCTVQ